MPAVEDYVRNAKLIRVIDGDTVEINIDLGFKVWLTVKARLFGIDCPEKTGITKEAGLAAERATRDWFARCGEKIIVKTHLDKTDSFGRVLVEVLHPFEIEDRNLADYLVKTGHAICYLP